MAKTITDKRTKIEEQIKQLETQRKQLVQQERAEAEKAKKQRLTNRGGLVEKLLPHLATLTDSEFEAFMQKALLSSEKPQNIIPEPQGGIIEQEDTKNDEE